MTRQNLHEQIFIIPDKHFRKYNKLNKHQRIHFFLKMLYYYHWNRNNLSIIGRGGGRGQQWGTVCLLLTPNTPFQLIPFFDTTATEFNQKSLVIEWSPFAVRWQYCIFSSIHGLMRKNYIRVQKTNLITYNMVIFLLDFFFII